MITAEYDYRAPDSLGEALQLLAADPDGTKILSGGMSLVPMMTLGLVAPERLVSLKNLPELRDVRETREHLAIGAMTPHCQVAANAMIRETVPLLAQSAAVIGDVQVRNRGTIGGSVVHADPGANYSPALVALEAELELAGINGTRRVPAIEFFTGLMETALADDEILIAIRIPMHEGNWGSSFQKFARVKGNFPIVCAAAMVQDRARSGKAGCVVIGGVCPTPKQVLLTATDMRGRDLGDAIRSVIDEPMGDANGSREYKTEMAVVYGTRAIAAAQEAIGS